MKQSLLKLSFCGSLLFHIAVFSVVSWVALSRGPAARTAEPLGMMQLLIVRDSIETTPAPQWAAAQEPETIVEPAPSSSVAPALENFELTDLFDEMVGDLLARKENVAEAAPAVEPASPAALSAAAVSTGIPDRGISPGESAGQGSAVDYLSNPKPVYPREARRRHEEGLVVLSVLVSTEGFPERVQVTQSSGFALLDQAALDAVRKWRFSPARSGTITLPSHVEVPVRFQLSH